MILGNKTRLQTFCDAHMHIALFTSQFTEITCEGENITSITQTERITGNKKDSTKNYRQLLYQQCKIFLQTHESH